MGCLGSTDWKISASRPCRHEVRFSHDVDGLPEWFIDAPNGGNGSEPWTNEEKAALKAAATAYKTRIRPMIRNADLYHILPRPDGKNWDGIQYFDSTTRKGVLYLFKLRPRRR